MVRVHLDHNATTPLRPEARAALLDALDRGLGNPSSIHAAGRAARAELDDARERVAAALGVEEDAILFTSGGTESDNLALFGSLEAAGRGAGLVTVVTEHSAVLEPARRLEAAGHPVTRVGVDAAGRPDLDALAQAAARPGVALVSVAAANSELGTLADLAGLAERLAALGDARPRLHTDAVQALGRVPVELDAWGADLASLSAHKVGGPVGVGVLVRRRGAPVAPRAWGGGQEAELRAGTENVAAVAAAAVAIELAVRERVAFASRARRLARELWGGVRASSPGARLLGPPIDAPDRLPNTLNILFPHVDGRTLVTRLDLEGLEASSGSACASGSIEPSHVLRAIGLDDERARAGLRLSIGRTTRDEDIPHAVDILSTTLGKTP